MYLSIILSGRNDNYGGDFNERLQQMVTWVYWHVEALRLPTELVLVNYNPLEDQPPLQDSIDWGANRKYLRIKIVTVPEAIHQNFVNPAIRKTVPLFEFIAKNIGIKRAAGEFLLCTNGDILIDPKVFEELAQQRLSSGYYYRSNRYDFQRPNIFSEDRSEKLQQIRQQVFKFFLQGGEYEMRQKWSFKRKYQWLQLYHPPRLWLLRSLFGTRPEWLYHCHASGDFTLMHQKHWLALRGHPEDTLISTHTDSLMVIKAVSAGLKEQVLKGGVYHQDHERRFNFEEDLISPEMIQMYDRLQEEGKQMLRDQQPLIKNDVDWGLGKMDLETIVF